MNTHPATNTLVDFLYQHWLSAFFLVLTLATILSILGARWWFRRRWKRLLEERFDEENDLDALPSPGPLDQKALAVIKEFRGEVWDLPEAELELSIEALNQRAVRITRSIAAVYYPEAEVPQYEASLFELLQMIRRVSSRLSRMGGAIPFKYLVNRKLSDYQRYYHVYRKINDNPILQILRRNPHIYRVAKWAMNVKNLGNPLYWAGKELSREGYFYMLRWFYLTFVSQVGREAMRLYSGRHFQNDEDRDAALICYRLFALTRQWDGPSPAEWRVLVDFVTNHSALDSESKIHILSRWSQERLPKDLDQQQVQTKMGAKWYRQGLKRLLEEDSSPPPQKVEVIEREMVGMEEMQNSKGEVPGAR